MAMQENTVETKWKSVVGTYTKISNGVLQPQTFKGTEESKSATRCTEIVSYLFIKNAS
jgi:hypothetical protein